MPEALKNLYNRAFVGRLANDLDGCCPEFKTDAFVNSVFSRDWKEKELKQRMRHITQTLHRFLPKDYRQALRILMPVSARYEGFEPMFFPDYVECYGLEDYEASIPALEWMTQFSSSEFAVRPFVVKYPQKMMRQMESWTKHENHHVRRLASEGCRPRLPWAMALPEFKQDPAPVLRVLKKLKLDDSEYVRRSVANNLNDISKDNPEVVVETARQWLGHTPETDWLVKHGCRSLLKQGDARVLRLFGFNTPAHVTLRKLKVSSGVNLGDELSFSFELATRQHNLGKLRIEYAIDFVRANNRTGRKMFKISEGEYSGKEKAVKKNHSFRQITTRKYYPGQHALRLYVNGHEMGKKAFVLHG